MNNSSNLY